MATSRANSLTFISRAVQFMDSAPDSKQKFGRIREQIEPEIVVCVWAQSSVRGFLTITGSGHFSKNRCDLVRLGDTSCDLVILGSNVCGFQNATTNPSSQMWEGIFPEDWPIGIIPILDGSSPAQSRKRNQIANSPAALRARERRRLHPATSL